MQSSSEKTTSELKIDFRKTLRKRNSVSLAGPGSSNLQIYGCWCDHTHHPTTVDHIEISPTSKMITLWFENIIPEPILDSDSNGRTCEIIRKRVGEMFVLQRINMSQAFVRALKWQTTQFSLECIKNGVPKFLTQATFQRILALERTSLIDCKAATNDEVLAQISCEDNSIRKVQLRLEVRPSENQLSTFIRIQDVLSEDKAQIIRKQVIQRKQSKLIKKILG